MVAGREASVFDMIKVSADIHISWVTEINAKKFKIYTEL